MLHLINSRPRSMSWPCSPGLSKTLCSGHTKGHRIDAAANTQYFVQAHRHSGSYFVCMFVLHVLSDCVPNYRQKRPCSASAGTPPLPTFGLGCRCLRQRAAGLEIQLPHAPGRCSSVVGSWRPPAGGGRVPSMGDAESPGGGAVGERRSAAGAVRRRREPRLTYFFGLSRDFL